MTQTMTQVAPAPIELARLVARLSYKEGWTFSLRSIDRGQGCEGCTLIIHIEPPDAYHPERLRPVVHYMPVPPAAFDRRSWQRWLLDQIRLVETHEACEFFAIGNDRPFAPNHGPGRDPYTIFEYATDEDRRTSFRGEVNP